MSGNPCDPNNPDGSEEEDGKNNSEEDSEENIPQNYPRRPAVARPRPTHPASTRAPTTVFQNRYNQPEVSDEEEQVQYAQIPRTTSRPVHQTERPRVQIVNTTPAPTLNYPANPISITPKPVYRVHNPNLSVQPVVRQPPATTYRPQTVSISTQRPISQTVYTTKSGGFQSSTRGPIDFDNEFKKFQQDNNYTPSPRPVTAAPVQVTSPKQQTLKIGSSPVAATGNPIYQSQLIYNPSTGQYDSNLYQSIAQTDSDFTLSHRIQPYVQHPQSQYQAAPQPTYFNQSPSLYNRNQIQVQSPQPAPQRPVPQQIYQKQQNELQFLNSQQLFAQQLQLQQSQLQRDRIEAQKKAQPVQSTQIHRFQLPQSAPLRQQLQQPAQQYYYVAPQGESTGQIDGFLRAHNIDY